MIEPWNSWLIGLTEIVLACFVFSRALPAAVAINDEAGDDKRMIARAIDRIARSPLRFLPALLALFRLLGDAIASRVMTLKLWMLGVALGCFGIGRAFGPSYAGGDAWLFSLGHYCLIAYASLRLLHIQRRAGSVKWWKDV